MRISPNGLIYVGFATSLDLLVDTGYHFLRLIVIDLRGENDIQWCVQTDSREENLSGY